MAGVRWIGRVGFRRTAPPRRDAIRRRNHWLGLARLDCLTLAERRNDVLCRRVGLSALGLVIPAFRLIAQLPTRPRPVSSTVAAESSAPAAAALIIGSLLFMGWGITSGRAETPPGAPPKSGAATKVTPPTPIPVAESITQQVRVEEKFALATAKIRWTAVKGQRLPLLFEPAVLTHLDDPTRSLKLVSAPSDSRRGDQLLAEANGTFDIVMQYQLRVSKPNEESGIALPTPAALVNQIKLTLVNLDVDVQSPQAVSIQRDNDNSGSNTVATLLLSPEAGTWIGWKPRSRDVKREKAVFYAEFYQLYVPAPGVIEGLHYAAIRPAQGELNELVFNVPVGATITDVIDPSTSGASANSAATIVSLWRFDPDTRKLRVTFESATIAAPFALAVRSQNRHRPAPV